jgi:hypothetical protein
MSVGCFGFLNRASPVRAAPPHIDWTRWHYLSHERLITSPLPQAPTTRQLPALTVIWQSPETIHCPGGATREEWNNRRDFE